MIFKKDVPAWVAFKLQRYDGTVAEIDPTSAPVATSSNSRVADCTFDKEKGAVRVDPHVDGVFTGSLTVNADFGKPGLFEPKTLQFHGAINVPQTHVEFSFAGA